MGLDSMAGWIWPYRTHVAQPCAIEFAVTVRNPLATDTVLRLRLSGPEGWEGSTAEVPAGAREEVTAAMSVTADGPGRRRAIVVELSAGEQPFGQVLEALVTVGGAEF
jgi:hypothetical protein